MYLAIIVLLMGVFPLVSILVELFMLPSPADLASLIGKWLVFWAVGIRLLLAGLRQIANPTFTADSIFGVKETGALPIVQELGFGNLSIGVLGVLSLLNRHWIAPAAVAGALFYGLAGINHLLRGGRNSTENIAMVSDLYIFLMLAGYLAMVMVHRL